MRAKTIAALLAATAIPCACAVPLSASAAKPHRYKQKPLISAELHLHGTHGFRIELSAIGSHGAFLSASKWTSRLGILSVNYSSLLRHGPKAFEAGRLNMRIGRLGRFRGRFVPTSTEKAKLAPECDGKPATIEKGFFVGSFDFRGERGYTAVHSHRARGTVTRQAAGVCSYSPGLWHESAREIREQKKRERNEFHLVAGDEGASVLFQARREDATKMPDAGPTTFQASMNGGKVGDFSIRHSAFLFGPEGEPAANFQTPNLAEPLAEATVTPPAPFSGSATFHLDGPNTASWTGDLAVEMPGLGTVPLTGSEIAAGLCNGPSNCTKTLPEDLQPVLEAPAGTMVAISISTPHS